MGTHNSDVTWHHVICNYQQFAFLFISSFRVTSFYFTVMSNEHQSIWNYQQPDCFFNSLFRLTSQKTSKLLITGPISGESTGLHSHAMTSQCRQKQMYSCHPLPFPCDDKDGILICHKSSRTRAHVWGNPILWDGHIKIVNDGSPNRNQMKVFFSNIMTPIDHFVWINSFITFICSI